MENMDAILPAAGLAKRLKGIPKFLLPADKLYNSLLEIHLFNLSKLCENIYLPTRPELVPIIKSLDIDQKKLKILEMNTKTMSETVNNTVSVTDADSYILIMPDTYFLGQQPYDLLNPDTEICNLACWEIRDSQRGKLGEVNVDNNNLVIDMIDKKIDSGLKYSWGALTFNRNLIKYIDNKDPHIGYAVKNALIDSKKINATFIKGKYFDCGTPEEYVELLKNIFL